MKRPISDYLIKDDITGRLRLTKEYAIELDPDIVNELKNPNDIEELLTEISDDIYETIHEYNVDNITQDRILERTQGGRKVLILAMRKQLLYVCAVGDVSLFLDEKRKYAISDKAMRELYAIIPEIGTTILYTGTLPCRFCETPPDKAITFNQIEDLF